jgi:hypothetical protein
MGDLAQTGVDKWAAWTGGKPKLDWTGFATATLDSKTPNQMHPIYDVKGYNHQKTGLSDKFNKTDTLIPFKKQVWTHNLLSANTTLGVVGILGAFAVMVSISCTPFLSGCLVTM